MLLQVCQAQVTECSLIQRELTEYHNFLCTASPAEFVAWVEGMHESSTPVSRPPVSRQGPGLGYGHEIVRIAYLYTYDSMVYLQVAT